MSARESQVLGGLLPDTAYAYECDLTAPWSGASTQRQKEFGGGRACAHAALHRMRIEGRVGRHRDRSPSWPSGACGSISHCAHLAVAVAGGDTDFESLGVDVEEVGVVSAELTPLLFTDKEQQTLATMGGADPLTAMFSMKEASYKCWFPLTGIVLEFTDVEVSADPSTGYFRAEMVTTSRKQPMHVQTQGRYATSQGHVFATAWIGSGRTP